MRIDALRQARMRVFFRTALNVLARQPRCSHRLRRDNSSPLQPLPVLASLIRSVYTTTYSQPQARRAPTGNSTRTFQVDIFLTLLSPGLLLLVLLGRQSLCRPADLLRLRHVLGLLQVELQLHDLPLVQALLDDHVDLVWTHEEDRSDFSVWRGREPPRRASGEKGSCKLSWVLSQISMAESGFVLSNELRILLRWAVVTFGFGAILESSACCLLAPKAADPP